MHSKNGIAIPANAPFTLDGEQYPANWLELAGTDDLLAAGVIYAPDPPPEVSDVKAAKLMELKDARLSALLVDVTVGGKNYPADSEYRELISNMVSRATRGKPLPATLRGSNGVPVTLTTTLLDSIENTIAAQMQAAWDRYWARVDAVNTASTADLVLAVVW
jgi:hypothetical protein